MKSACGLLAVACVLTVSANPTSNPYVAFRTSPRDQIHVHHELEWTTYTPKSLLKIVAGSTTTTTNSASNSQCPLQFSLGISRRLHSTAQTPEALKIVEPPIVYPVLPSRGPGRQVLHSTQYEHLDMLTPISKSATTSLDPSSAVIKEGMVQQEGFPLLFESSSFVTSPIIHDVNADGIPDAILSDYDGGIYVVGLTAAHSTKRYLHKVQVPRLYLRREWVVSRLNNTEPHTQQATDDYPGDNPHDPFHSYFEYGFQEKDSVLRGVTANLLGQGHEDLQALQKRRKRRVSHQREGESNEELESIDGMELLEEVEEGGGGDDTQEMEQEALTHRRLQEVVEEPIQGDVKEDVKPAEDAQKAADGEETPKAGVQDAGDANVKPAEGAQKIADGGETPDTGNANEPPKTEEQNAGNANEPPKTEEQVAGNVGELPKEGDQAQVVQAEEPGNSETGQVPQQQGIEEKQDQVNPEEQAKAAEQEKAEGVSEPVKEQDVKTEEQGKSEEGGQAKETEKIEEVIEQVKKEEKEQALESEKAEEQAIEKEGANEQDAGESNKAEVVEKLDELVVDKKEQVEEKNFADADPDSRAKSGDDAFGTDDARGMGDDMFPPGDDDYGGEGDDMYAQYGYGDDFYADHGAKHNEYYDDKHYVRIPPHILCTPVLLEVPKLYGNKDEMQELLLVPVSYYMDEDEYQGFFSYKRFEQTDRGDETEAQRGMYVANAMMAYDLTDSRWGRQEHLDLSTDHTAPMNETLLGVYPVMEDNSKMGAFALSNPGVGDIDGDGNIEIIFGTSMGFVYCFDARHMYSKEGWPIQMKRAVESRILVEDVIGDTNLEVFVADVGGNIVCLDHKATMIWHRDLLPSVADDGDEMVASSPMVLGDVDGDGLLDLVIVVQFLRAQGQRMTVVFALDASTGKDLSNFPMQVRSSPDEMESMSGRDLINEKLAQPLLVDLHASQDYLKSYLLRNGTKWTKPPTKSGASLHGGNAPGLHIVQPVGDTLFIVEAGSGCTQQVAVGDEVLTMVQVDDVHGTNSLDLVVSTASGNVITLESSSPFHPLNTWRNGETRGRLGGSAHGFSASQGIFVHEMSRQYRDIFGIYVPVTFEIFDNRPNIMNEPQKRIYKVEIRDGTSSRRRLFFNTYNATGVYTERVYIPYGPGFYTLTVLLRTSHGLVYEDMLHLGYNVHFLDGFGVLLWLPLVLASLAIFLCGVKKASWKDEEFDGDDERDGRGLGILGRSVS